MVISFLWFLWREPESCFEKVLNRTHVGDNQKIPLKGEKNKTKNYEKPRNGARGLCPKFFKLFLL